MFTTHLKATICTHIYTLRVIANKPTKVIKWNQKNCQAVQKKVEEEIRNRWKNEQQIIK